MWRLFAFWSFVAVSAGPQAATRPIPMTCGSSRTCEIYRDEQGFTQAVRASEIQGIPEFIKAGASLGHLWMEGHFGLGDPLINHGAPPTKSQGRA